MTGVAAPNGSPELHGNSRSPAHPPTPGGDSAPVTGNGDRGRGGLADHLDGCRGRRGRSIATTSTVCWRSRPGRPAALLSASILSLRDPLETTLEIENATGGDVATFNRFVSTSSGPDRPFVSAVLCGADGTTWRPVSVVGVKPLMAHDSAQARSFISKATKSPTFVVTPVPA